MAGGWTNVPGQVVGTSDADPGAGNLIVDGSIKAGSGNVTIADATGKIPEAAIDDDGVLARKADNETISGAYTFTGGVLSTAPNATATALELRARSTDDVGFVGFKNNDGDTELARFAFSTAGSGTLAIGTGSSGTNRVTFDSSGATFANGQVKLPNGSASAPALAFSNDTDCGLFRTTQNVVEIASGGVSVFQANCLSGGAPQITIPSADYGSGAADGPKLVIGRNTNASAAPGVLSLVDRSGFGWELWVDTSGKLRIDQTAPQNGDSDTTGTVVGAQS